MATVRTPAQKVILCGEYGAGKSSLFRRFANNTFVTAADRAATMGLDNYDRIYRVGDHGKEINVSFQSSGESLILNSFPALPPLSSAHWQLSLWDTGGMERVASVTSSYYKFAEAAILVFALDSPTSFNALSQHMLDIVTYASNAKIFLCGNKSDVQAEDHVTDADMEEFCEQCQNLITGTFKTSCKTNEGVAEMFQSIANTLGEANRSRIELQSLEQSAFKVQAPPEGTDDSCAC